MIRPPPDSPRPDTLFPDPTHFRVEGGAIVADGFAPVAGGGATGSAGGARRAGGSAEQAARGAVYTRCDTADSAGGGVHTAFGGILASAFVALRRRVGVGGRGQHQRSDDREGGDSGK